MQNITEPNRPLTDFSRPFQLDRSGVRGRIVRLGPVLDTLLGQHGYPAAVAALVAQLTVTACALGSLLKYEGVFTLQTKTDGPVRVMVADVTSAGGVRAMAQFDESRLDQPALLGEGMLAFTADLGGASAERYQGIVELNDAGLTDAVQRYFRQSEQIPTGTVVAVRQDAGGHWTGGGIILQRLPDEGGHRAANDSAVEDDWLRALSLLQTCSEAELADPTLAAEDLLYRLFHEEDVRVYEPKALSFACRCSRERVMGILRSMEAEERAAIEAQGLTDVTCGFCGKVYSFTRDEVAKAGEKEI
jgi:molecular chaperone Hsp33